jgi:hypothetical protein
MSQEQQRSCRADHYLCSTCPHACSGEPRDALNFDAVDVRFEHCPRQSECARPVTVWLKIAEQWRLCSLALGCFGSTIARDRVGNVLQVVSMVAMEGKGSTSLVATLAAA